ncbi:hypothetical protein SUDANB176_06556 [Streptomyces sp. enrichment culture]|uniref:hypothetical protein n=1 Tax=Streptomyces sp. enrichment culture TaxID=1795815 RepID=UPI003F571AFF
MTTLLVLGAAGGALRGLLDVYVRFLDWQADRRVHRRSPPEQVGPPPRFADYFDPVGDSVAAVVHSAMGAGAAVLFGTTGQISGAYAALVVGISAPVVLTQLGRVQSVSDALTSQPVAQPATDAGAPGPAPPPEPVMPAETREPSAVDGAPAPVRTVASPPGTPRSRSRDPLPDGAGEAGTATGGGDRPPLSRGPALGEEGST